VPVCRLSGKLPNEGCSQVEVEKDTGEVQVRNMVLTEYFARGSAPKEICELHPSRPWLRRVAGLFGAEGAQPARETDLALPPVSAATPPPPATATTTAHAEAADAKPAAAEQEKPKKRGFWSRLFGRRDKDDRDKSERDDKKQEDEKNEKRPDPRRPSRPPG
jgi:hypothetical protein